MKVSRERRNMPAHVFIRLERPDTFLFILDLEKITKGHGISSVGLGVMKPICVRIWEYAEEESSIPA